MPPNQPHQPMLSSINGRATKEKCPSHAIAKRRDRSLFLFLAPSFLCIDWRSIESYFRLQDIFKRQEIIFNLAMYRVHHHWMFMIATRANHLDHCFLRSGRSATFGWLELITKKTGSTARNTLESQVAIGLIFNDLKNDIQPPAQKSNGSPYQRARTDRTRGDFPDRDNRAGPISHILQVTHISKDFLYWQVDENTFLNFYVNQIKPPVLTSQTGCG